MFRSMIRREGIRSSEGPLFVVLGVSTKNCFMVSLKPGCLYASEEYLIVLNISS